jgi:hypothetical protein
MNLAEMVAASATNSIYFNDYKFTSKNGTVSNIIGGSSVAESPALYAFFSATEFLNVPQEKISVTVVGAVKKATEKISGRVNPIQWLNRIISLTSPVKKQTQEYMLEHLVEANRKPFIVFDYSVDNNWSLGSFFGIVKTDEAKSVAEDMMT